MADVFDFTTRKRIQADPQPAAPAAPQREPEMDTLWRIEYGELCREGSRLTRAELIALRQMVRRSLPR